MERSRDRQWRPPRTCDNYLSEFRHCKSLRNRFHHYYVFGTPPVCHQWKEDYNNCRAWEKYSDTNAKEALQSSEKNRVAEQTNFSPVWELRKAPPSDWNVPLDENNKPYNS
ncbi:UPF0545 protein C22orf39 homolog [Synchiropus splendidus]|uniref:UPF0545 protein C22orf39 homolog n=1 Tax=Synchiropus splendidus TaxID=270530 RepID=UPI00237EDF8E|nr:UPF0545 protein C22orf39 homolog [Synchiropus splendidus]